MLLILCTIYFLISAQGISSSHVSSNILDQLISNSLKNLERYAELHLLVQDTSQIHHTP
jgi:hypothetical protein